jgi:hypothetical protein
MGASMRNSFLVVYLTAVLTGCASVSLDNLTRIEAGIEPVAKTSFTLVDQRSEDVKAGSVFEYAGTRQLYLADSRVSPAPLELVKAWLEKMASSRLEGLEVVLTKFELRIIDGNPNVDQDRLATASASVPGGFLAAPLAGLLISTIERSTRTSARITLTVNGEEIRAAGYQNYRGELTAADVAATLQLALDDLATKVNVLDAPGKQPPTESAR